MYRARSHDNAREYALKYLVPTVKPSRIATELRYMRDVGGKCNVVELLGCFYNAGHTVIIMPILPHERFTDYVSDLTLEEIKDYMKNLLIALERVHSYHIIHRDIKPANFLYDRKSRKYMLVDFGLAQSEKEIYRLAKMYISEKNEQDKQIQAQQNGNSNTNLNVMINPFRLTSNSRDALKERTFDSLNNTLLKSESKGWQIRKRTINEANFSESKKVPKRLCTESRNQTTPSVFNSPITPSVFTTPTKVPPAKKEKLSVVTEESPMSMIPETPPKEYQKNNVSIETPNAHGYPLKIEETPKNQDKITSSESVNSNKSTCEVTSASNENASSCDENPSEQQTYKQTYPDSPISPGEMVIDESCSNLTSSTSPSGKVYGHSNPTSPINTSTTQMSQISTTESSDVKEQQKIQSTISSSSTNAEKDCPSQSFSVSSSVCDSEKVNAKSTEENKITNETESEKSSSQVTSSNVSQKIANSDPQSNDSSQTPNNESGSIVSGSGSDTLTNRSSPAAQNVTDETPIVDSNVSESVQPNLTSTVQSSTVSASGQASSTTSSSLPQYEPLSDDE